MTMTISILYVLASVGGAVLVGFDSDIYVFSL